MIYLQLSPQLEKAKHYDLLDLALSKPFRKNYFVTNHSRPGGLFSLFSFFFQLRRFQVYHFSQASFESIQ
jgi:hypothetical protein